eukprot:3278737-Pyramimonas_sp.AAC.1
MCTQRRKRSKGATTFRSILQLYLARMKLLAVDTCDLSHLAASVLLVVYREVATVERKSQVAGYGGRWLCTCRGSPRPPEAA